MNKLCAFAAMVAVASAMKLAPDTRRNVVYIDWKVTSWEDLGVDIRIAVDNGYNVINIAFWMFRAVADAATVWSDTMNAAQRQAALDYAHARQAVIIVAAGGATDLLLGPNNPAGPVEYCTAASQWAVQYGLDGVDFDVELQPGDPSGFIEGWATDWLVTCSTVARNILGPNREISHAPQAPYFGTWAGQTLGYVAIEQRAGTAIDYYNIQYYNQGVGVYTNLEEIFLRTQPGSFIAQTAVAEIAANSVDMNKLVVGKPLLPIHAGSGYVDVNTLASFVTQARAQLGWTAGVMTWMWEPEESATTIWGRTMSSALGSKNDTTPIQHKPWPIMRSSHLGW